MRDLAEQFGPPLQSNRTSLENKFTQIRAGRLMPTCSHKLGPEYFMLRRSSFRDSNARQCGDEPVRDAVYAEGNAGKTMVEC